MKSPGCKVRALLFLIMSDHKTTKMKFTESSNKMKAFETNMTEVAPGMYIVARLNSRGVIRHSIEVLVETTEHLMTCGFNVTYAYTENNETSEISLLFDVNENSYGRKTSKFVSILASEASAKLTQLTGILATFDSRVLALPNKDLVVDYFRSRASDTENSSWSYWKVNTNGRHLISVRNGEMIADLMDT